MAKKKVKTEKESKPSLLDDVSLDITAELELDTLQLKGLRWYTRLFVEAILPRAYHQYHVTLLLNEKPYLERIDKLEKSLDDTLFKDDRAQKRRITEQVMEQNKQLAELRRDCEKFEFDAMVTEIKYKDDGTVVLLRIPDAVIEPFNRQKHRMNLYHVILSPKGV